MKKLLNRLRFRKYLKSSVLPFKSIFIATSYYCPVNHRLITTSRTYEV